MLFFYTSLLFVLPSAIVGFKSGPPLGVCQSMTPGHGVAFQTGNGPFTLQVKPDKSGIFTVNIETSGESFKGFMVQARDTSTDKVIGKFLDHKYRNMDCNKIQGSTVSHGNNQLKSKVNLMWELPKDFPSGHKIVFKATVVKSYGDIYSLSKTVETE